MIIPWGSFLSLSQIRTLNPKMETIETGITFEGINLQRQINLVFYTTWTHGMIKIQSNIVSITRLKQQHFVSKFVSHAVTCMQYKYYVTSAY